MSHRKELKKIHWRLETSKTAKMLWDLIYRVEYLQGGDFKMTIGDMVPILGKNNTKTTRKHIRVVLEELDRSGYIRLTEGFDGKTYYEAKINKKWKS